MIPVFGIFVFSLLHNHPIVNSYKTVCCIMISDLHNPFAFKLQFLTQIDPHLDQRACKLMWYFENKYSLIIKQAISQCHCCTADGFTVHYRDVTWAGFWNHNNLTFWSTYFRLTTKKILKLHITSPSWGEIHWGQLIFSYSLTEKTDILIVSV